MGFLGLLVGLGLPLWGGSHVSPVLHAQIALDRAGFSPGEIDGLAGANFERALRGFQQQHRLTPTGKLDESTRAALHAIVAEPLVSVALTHEDVNGPFEKVPADPMEQGKLKALGFESAMEALGERYHVGPQLLRKLNEGRPLKPGVEWLVPDIGTPVTGRAATVEVSDTTKTMLVRNRAGKIIAQYPVTTGSEHDPLPIGTWKITGVYRNPDFFYNPDLFWDAQPHHAKTKIAPGPNNPVGVVWIDMNKEHYGIHGTPEPAQVGHVASHGCIRLTNWDAAELAALVAKGVVVRLVK